MGVRGLVVRMRAAMMNVQWNGLSVGTGRLWHVCKQSPELGTLSSSQSHHLHKSQTVFLLNSWVLFLTVSWCLWKPDSFKACKGRAGNTKRGCMVLQLKSEVKQECFIPLLFNTSLTGEKPERENRIEHWKGYKRKREKLLLFALNILIITLLNMKLVNNRGLLISVS
jgi:hypothetical protein